MYVCVCVCVCVYTCVCVCVYVCASIAFDSLYFFVKHLHGILDNKLSSSSMMMN